MPADLICRSLSPKGRKNEDGNYDIGFVSRAVGYWTADGVRSYESQEER